MNKSVIVDLSPYPAKLKIKQSVLQEEGQTASCQYQFSLTDDFELISGDVFWPAFRFFTHKIYPRPEDWSQLGLREIESYLLNGNNPAANARAPFPAAERPFWAHLLQQLPSAIPEILAARGNQLAVSPAGSCRCYWPKIGPDAMVSLLDKAGTGCGSCLKNVPELPACRGLLQMAGR